MDRDSRWRKTGAAVVRMFLPVLLVLLPAGDAGSREFRTDAEKMRIVDGLYDRYKARWFPNVADISPRAAMRLHEQGAALFVDVREEPEIRVSTLPGAINGTEFRDHPERYSGKQVIVYCTISMRSGRFARRMRRRGVAVTNLRGGILAWILAGGRIVSRGKETRRVHVYDKDWNYAADGYEAVW